MRAVPTHITAIANTDHARSAPGSTSVPQEFQSDLIQSEALAKAIALRLMRWHNREPDVLRIQCGNDARIAPGQLVTVKDASCGIDLTATNADLVLGVTRDGDGAPRLRRRRRPARRDVVSHRRERATKRAPTSAPIRRRSPFPIR